jgi:hypothetical protein
VFSIGAWGFWLPLAASDLDASPPSFNLDLGNSKLRAVYIDIQKAEYHLEVQFEARKVLATSTLTFVTAERGAPMFDLVPSPSQVFLDGEAVEVSSVQDPDRRSRFRVALRQVEPGTHELRMTHSLTHNVEFDGEGVRMAFWMSDLSDRTYLEQYLPTNFEYDHMAMDLTLNLASLPKPHVLYTNGEQTREGANRLRIQFPEGYTASSIYFHLTPGGRFSELKGLFPSADGREIPIVIYTQDQDLTVYMEQTLRYLKELEGDYGPFPHPRLVIYGGGWGGMEYCGATITELFALGHELTHSYFARGVMPTHGDSGWIDEAIASWRDAGYRRMGRPSFRSNMGRQSPYKRDTDRRAYREGRDFVGFLDGLFNPLGGMKPMLKKLKETYLFASITSEQFRNFLEEESNMNLQSEFDRYIYDVSAPVQPLDSQKPKSKAAVNPYHVKLSPEQLRSLL